MLSLLRLAMFLKINLLIVCVIALVACGKNTSSQENLSPDAAQVAVAEPQNESTNSPMETSKLSIADSNYKVREIVQDGDIYNNIEISGEYVFTSTDTLVENSNDLYGHNCYVYGFKEGNGLAFVVDQITGKVYVCIEKGNPSSPTVLRHITRETMAYENQQAPQYSPPENQVKSDGNSTTVEGIVFSNFVRMPFDPGTINLTLKIENASDRKHYFTPDDFIIRKQGESSIQPNRDSRFKKVYSTDPEGYVWNLDSVELYSGDSNEVNLYFYTPEDDPVGYVLYYDYNGSLVPLCNIQ